MCKLTHYNITFDGVFFLVFGKPPTTSGLGEDILDNVTWLRNEHDRNLFLVTIFCAIFDKNSVGIGAIA
jgi:hypothetical protein